MSSHSDAENATQLSPDDAFGLLGNETRIQILQTLGRADEPLTFSALFDRTTYDDSSNFVYHLEKLDDHFIDETSEGYILSQAGKRVIKAVLSGAVTEDPEVETTHPEEWTCPYCGAAAQMGYDQERVWTACPECAGTYDVSVAPRSPMGPADHGFIGHARLPPAGIEGRNTRQIKEAAASWGHLDFLAMASGVCSRCAAIVEHSVNVCGKHDGDDGICGQCNSRHAVQVHAWCTNCIHEEVGPFVLGYLVATTELINFLASHGLNPVSPSQVSSFYRALLNYDEEVLSMEPFTARFTFSVDGDELALTVDEDLSVVEVRKRSPSDAK